MEAIHAADGSEMGVNFEVTDATRSIQLVKMGADLWRDDNFQETKRKKNHLRQGSNPANHEESGKHPELRHPPRARCLRSRNDKQPESPRTIRAAVIRKD